MHPKWGTPAVALVTQAVCCMVFIVLGQAGSTVHGAYQVLVTMTIITNFVPYLFMFAAMIRLQREPVEAGVIRVPGGKPVAIALATVRHGDHERRHRGLVVPDPSEPNKLLASQGRGLQRGADRRGVLLYWSGPRRAHSGTPVGPTGRS